MDEDNPFMQRCLDELARQMDESKGLIYIERDPPVLTQVTIDGDIDLVALVNAILG